MLDWNYIINNSDRKNASPPFRVEKTHEEWRSELTPEVFRVTRNKGTERPHSSDMCTLFEPGKYACTCCKTELFDAARKFDSGTGWPSFNQPINPSHVAYHSDSSFGMVRIEATCNICDAHLGHVFPDGPEPSGLRYCINAVSLEKIKE
ncbi:MAG: peptide-methionine (R)-S-oxide reductase MsrB [Cyclobacteriaceae bacterium]